MSDFHIASLDVFDADLALVEPFGIATGAQTLARNAFVRLTLVGGAVGWGEAAPFPAVNGETRERSRADLVRTPWLGRDARAWRLRAAETADLCGSAQCALQTALLDALCGAWGVPMWAWFGGAARSIETDVTITTGTVDEARAAATRLVAEGVRTLKVKVGHGDDEARLDAIVEVAPRASLLLDGNCALPDVATARALVTRARERGAHVALFEQPFAREALDLHAELRSDVRVALDESVASPADVVRAARLGACDVVNLKATKSGLFGVMDMAITARGCGLQTMIGAMVESQLGLGAAAALAAGMGGFAFVDLDTHRWLAASPIEGGFSSEGPWLHLPEGPGHGARYVPG